MSVVFDPSLLEFLTDLAANNRRDWFKDNKRRYETEVVEPVMDFIGAMQPRLQDISEHFLAITGKIGGSMMRIYRDVRFSANKQPYKTNVGIQFRHELGRDVHAPGFYVHLEPGECFLGAGIWHPASDALGAIRRRIDEAPAEWRKVQSDTKLHSIFELSGDSLKTAPKGYPKDHPLIEDLRRKDFIGVLNVSDADIVSDAYLDLVSDSFAASRSLMKFLCTAMEVPF